MAPPVSLPDVGEAFTKSNFGRNVTWNTRLYCPKDEDEVLEILERHRHGHIRALGARHSWSDIALCDVSIDMAHFADVRVVQNQGRTVARVGAGCRIGALLDSLAAIGLTLPTMGVIKLQAIAGAIATGTHGSGKPSLSNHVVAVRVATWSAQGVPHVVDIRDGEALEAARCGLGCTGIVVGVELEVEPEYWIEEKLRFHRSFDELMKRYADYPLTQFAVMPYEWFFVAFLRRRVARKPGAWWYLSRPWALYMRFYNFVFVDWLGHLALRAWIESRVLRVQLLLFWMPLLFLKGWILKRTDRDQVILTMNHQFFEHEEMEVFVPQSRLGEALELLRYATLVCAHTKGEIPALPPALQERLAKHGFDTSLRALKDTYAHHYPYSMRKVLPDDKTLISMAAGVTEPWFSISIFSFARAGNRDAYYAYCAWVSRSMTELFGARLHWGKHFPQDAGDVERVYGAARMKLFRDVCERADPHGVFRNGYTERVLGLPPGRPPAPRDCPRKIGIISTAPSSFPSLESP